MNNHDSTSEALQTTTLIIPAYQPGEGLVELVTQLARYAFDEIVIVDDGSGSSYFTIFDKVSTIDRVTLLLHESNRGKGAALKYAFRHVLRNGVEMDQRFITLDADGQHAVEDVVSIAQRCKNRRECIVLGVRAFSENTPLRSRFGNQLTRKVLNWTKQVDLLDSQTGLRCLPPSFLEQSLTIEANRYDFELECILLAKQNGWPIEQHPIQTIYIDGNVTSHFRPILDSIRIYWVFVRYTIVSISSFALDIGLFTLLYYYSDYIIGSTYVSRMVSGTFNFLANKHAVFQSGEKQRYPRELLQYVGLAVFIATVSGVLVQKLVVLTAWQAPIVKIIVDGALFVVNFLVQRFLIFRPRS